MQIGMDAPLNLINPEDNGDRYLRYIISLGGTELYKTDLIPSGMMEQWYPGRILGTGEHHVTIVIQGFKRGELDGFVALDSNTQEIDLTVV